MDQVVVPACWTEERDVEVLPADGRSTTTASIWAHPSLAKPSQRSFARGSRHKEISTPDRLKASSAETRSSFFDVHWSNDVAINNPWVPGHMMQFIMDRKPPLRAQHSRILQGCASNPPLRAIVPLAGCWTTYWRLCHCFPGDLAQPAPRIRLWGNRNRHRFAPTSKPTQLA